MGDRDGDEEEAITSGLKVKHIVVAFAVCDVRVDARGVDGASMGAYAAENRNIAVIGSVYADDREQELPAVVCNDEFMGGQSCYVLHMLRLYINVCTSFMRQMCWPQFLYMLPKVKSWSIMIRPVLGYIITNFN